MTISQTRARGWRLEALCAQVGGDAWFPRPGEHILQTALDCCRDCPVRYDCLASALAHGDQDGVWAGLVPAELTQLRDRILAGQPAEQVIHDGLTTASARAGEAVNYRAGDRFVHDRMDIYRVAVAVAAVSSAVSMPDLPGRCIRCADHFELTATYQLYCSARCRNAAMDQRRRERRTRVDAEPSAGWSAA